MLCIEVAVAVSFDGNYFLDSVVRDLMEVDEIGPSLLEVLNKLSPAVLYFLLLFGTEGFLALFLLLGILDLFVCPDLLLCHDAFYDYFD